MSTYSLTSADLQTLRTFLEKKSLYSLAFEPDGRPRLEQAAGRRAVHLKDGLPWALGWVCYNSISHTIPEAERLEMLYRYARAFVEEARHESA